MIPKRGRLIDWKMIVLLTIKTTGILSVSLLVPNALRMFKLFDNKNSKKQSLKRAFKRLERDGLIVKNVNGKYQLSDLGQMEVNNFEFQTKKKRLWDGKWRAVIFDITGGRNNTRNRLREYLQNAGFYMLQQSVWVYPHSCGEIIDLLRIELSLRKSEIVCFSVNDFGSAERELRKFFKISK